MGSTPDGWWRDRAAARRRLVASLAEFAQQSGDEVTVVFDGRPVPGEPEAAAALGVSAAFAPGGPDAADDVIAARVAAAGTAEDTTVVTSDAGLVRRARAAGVGVVGSGAFGRRLSDPGRRPRPDPGHR